MPLPKKTIELPTDYTPEMKRRMETHLAYCKRNGLETYLSNGKFGYKIPKIRKGKGLQKKILNQVWQDYKKDGFSKDDLTTLWSMETGINFHLALKYMKRDTHPMPVWELEAFLKTFGYKINIEKIDKSNRFKFEVERDRLILRCTKWPMLTVNMNIEDPYDFTIESKKTTPDIQAMSTRAHGSKNLKITKIFGQMLQLYFLKQAGKRKYPFELQKMLDIFESRYNLIRYDQEL
ncbi:hypothetical protein [Epilithonimonas sp.]|uniref:hypothetical protein n=1 Tax=Epilithonimonas sp. TaxID=2894511 RepID=UPI0035B44776